MHPSRSQRGEGKIGCIISLLVLAVLVAVAYKAVPVYYAQNEFQTAVENISTRAGILPLPTIEAQIRDKAKELGIMEALDPGAITVTKSGDPSRGTCTVRLHYTRKIDFYGVYTYAYVTDSTRNTPFMDVR